MRLLDILITLNGSNARTMALRCAGCYISNRMIVSNMSRLVCRLFAMQVMV